MKTELYKCFILTIIAFLLFGIYIKMPEILTMEKVNALIATKNNEIIQKNILRIPIVNVWEIEKNVGVVIHESPFIPGRPH